MTDTVRDDRFAPPVAHVEDVVGAQMDSGLASRSSRFGAAVVDVIILMALLWVVARLTPWNPFYTRGRSLMAADLSNSIGVFAVFMLTQGYLLVQRGQTIGKALLKIRIVRLDGSLASAPRLIGLRYGVGSLLNVVPAIGQVFGVIDALFIFGKSRRCLHDHISGTQVVKA